MQFVSRTACGLYVTPGTHPRTWSNFTWATEVADVAGDQEDLDALALIAQELRQQIGEENRTHEAVMATDVAFAVLHPGEQERINNILLNDADPPVPDEVVDGDGQWPQQVWTVCGLLEDSWRPVCYSTQAGTALMAYYRAWQQAMVGRGEHMLLAGVHAGEVGRLDCFEFADPWTRDEFMMRAKVRSEWQVTSS